MDANKSKVLGDGNGARKWPCRIVTVNEMQIGFMHEKGTTGAELILRKLQNSIVSKGKKSVLRNWKKLLREYQGRCRNG